MPILELTPERLEGLGEEIDTRGFRAGRYPFPDFLIVGPQRTGSSWLRTNLCKHPQVFMPFKKEIFFFSHLGRKEHKRYRSNRLEDYCGLFRIRLHKRLERAGKALCHGLLLPETIRGEATASYATMPEPFVRNIFAIYPGMKIVVMVRDPIERAWSHAKKALVRDRGRRLEDIPFAEFEKYYRGSANLQRGMYSSIIGRWRSLAREGGVYVAEYRNLVDDPLGLVTEVQKFLGIASGPRFARKHLHTVVNPTSREPAPPAHRELLEELFAAEIERLAAGFGIHFG